MYTPAGLDLPEYVEWVRGEAFPKVSPGTPHRRIQVTLGAQLFAWGSERGIIATECDIDLTVAPNDVRRYLPDVQFTSFATIDAYDQDGLETQTVAPDLTIEIRSPHQHWPYLHEKVRAFVGAGTQVALVVDPEAQAIDVHTSAGMRRLERGDAFSDDRFPGLVIDVTALFDTLVRKR